MTVTLRAGEKILLKVLTDPLEKRGFKRVAELRFARGHNPESTLAFGVRLEDNHLLMCSFNLGIRSENLEKILNPEPIAPSTPTILMPIHLLTPGREWKEWPFQKEDVATALLPTILELIEKFGEPFWRKYSVLRNVQSVLDSQAPADWFFLDGTQRIGLLAAIKFIDGDANGATQFLDSALLERKGALPKKWLPLKRIRERIELVIKAT